MEYKKHTASETNHWKGLFLAGGVSAIIMLIFIPLQVLVFVISPPPKTVLDWFTLLNNKILVGLVNLDLLLIIDQVLMGLIIIALFQILKRTSKSYMMIAIFLALLGIAAYLSSTSAFEMLTLSHKYISATSEPEKNTLLAAGQVILATWQGTAFNVGYVTEGLALLIIGFVMLQNRHFNKLISFVGILLGCMSLVPPTAGNIGMILALGSLVPLWLWLLLISRRLFHYAQLEHF
jgi:hypothetical protein